ncbi:MAG: PLP-dependent aspartate aminotransferase family protein [Alphaproteobacteria bacterium]|jgi:cystathionine gamma-synthase|nr:PLP-dependent aspartate aminotransferase family protein [Alphaproteobacteria bacterium]MDP6590515.1 PLP-dependent aspartate aminotransferase family protein [Alphaproteobacteria bacterium]MDP6818622.1 PLP-dependent aspartate aminotransferase family protein [Alphaproteobacteria bacterium]
MKGGGRKGETIAAQAGHYIDAGSGAVTPPIQPSVTFARDADYALIDPAYVYGRGNNPTVAAAEALLARLEGAEAALLFASGLAAANALFATLAPGARVVAPRIMYHGMLLCLSRLAAAGRIDLALFDAARPEALEEAITAAETALVWIESPCNPTWEVIDIAAAARLAHAAGARLAVDSTVATPVLTRPIELGADVVFHSATKYLNGHSDVLAGALLSATADDAWRRVGEARWLGGAVLGPFEAWLLIRGLRTLYLRVHRASQSALAIASHFEGHEKLDAVLYPGLAGHPGHAVAARQMSGGFGGMLSVLVGGGRAAALGAVSRAEIFLRATSLGGVESLIEHRATIEGPESHVPENMLRLSVGIEDAGELIADLEQMLAGAP